MKTAISMLNWYFEFKKPQYSSKHYCYDLFTVSVIVFLLVNLMQDRLLYWSYYVLLDVIEYKIDKRLCMACDLQFYSCQKWF